MIEEIKTALANTGAQTAIIFKNGDVHVVSRWGASGFSAEQFEEWVRENQSSVISGQSSVGGDQRLVTSSPTEEGNAS